MKTKRVGMYRPKYTKKNTNNKSKDHTKKTIKHKTIKRRTYNQYKQKNLARNWIDDFVHGEETVLGGGKNNKRTAGTGTQNYPNFNKSTQSTVKKSTVKKSTVKKSVGVVTPPEVTPPEVTPPEITKPEVSPPEVTPPEVSPPEVTKPEITKPEVSPPEVTPPEITKPEVTIPNQTEVDNGNNRYDICPSRDKTPHQPVNRSDYLKETLIFHPDKNTGCIDSANEKFLQLSKMEELRKNSTETNDVTQPNSISSSRNSEEPVTDNTTEIPITNTFENTSLDTDDEKGSSLQKKIPVDDKTLNPSAPDTNPEIDNNDNNSGIGKFDVSISYPNGLTGTPIVNLTGTQGGDTDAVFGAIAQETGAPSSQTLSKVNGGKYNRRKKPNRTNKHKRVKNHNPQFNTTMKIRNKKL